MELDFLARYLITAIAAGLIAFVGTPLTLVIARKVGFLDSPSPRKPHLAPIPVMGGVAIWAAFVVSLLVFGGGREFAELISIVIGGTLISVVGLIDDRYGLGPRGKLIGQAAAALVLIFGGIQTQIFGNQWLNVLLTIVWVVGIVNALNLMDNMDGLAAGVAAAAAGSFLLLAILNGQILVASLGAALLGACLGFLFYNFQPAVTFMGDTGSMLLGFALAVLGIKLTFPTLPLAQSWMVPILVLGLPIFDTTLVLISRQRRGRPWWQGGTDHVSHRLARLGLSHRRVVVALYGVTAGLGLIAVLVTLTPSRELVWLMTAGVALLGIMLLYVMEQLLAAPDRTILHPDMHVVVIAGGAGTVPIVRAAASIAANVSVILTPAATENSGQQESVPSQFREIILALAARPGAVGNFLPADILHAGEKLATLSELANSAFRLRGRLLVNQTNVASEAALNALKSADLVILGGELAENVVPTLSISELARVMRRSRRPRVLVHPDPRKALAELQVENLDMLITHAVAPDGVLGPWKNVGSLEDSAEIAASIKEIWLERVHSRGPLALLAGVANG